MLPPRHRLLWIDARAQRDAPSLSAAARDTFDVVPAPLSAPLQSTPLGDTPPEVVVVEIGRASVERLDALRRAVAHVLARATASPSTPRPSARASASALAIGYIEANLAGRVTLDGAARVCRLSPCEMSRRFRQERHETFSSYVLRRRIERARDLLAAGEESVSRVAYAVGFNDLSYFARVFRRMVGMPASAYVARLDHPDAARAD